MQINQQSLRTNNARGRREHEELKFPRKSVSLRVFC